jgi:hypothetical protein
LRLYQLLDLSWAERDGAVATVVGMKKLIAVITALALTMSIGVATASAATQYEGKVVGISKERKTFRLADAQRGTIRIKVTRNTWSVRAAAAATVAPTTRSQKG